MKMRFLIVVGWLAAASPAFAVEPREVLPDPTLEARARAISQDLRCLVCQNQSIDDSDADLARDLRKIVRERIVEGDGDQAVLSYVVSRYGDFVLLRPRLTPKTYILWFGPIVILLLAFGALAVFYRRHGLRDGDAPVPLLAEERRRLEAILKDDPQ